jgi:hypothetical protein
MTDNRFSDLFPGITNPAEHDRHLLVDELNDWVEPGTLASEELSEIVNFVLSLLDKEPDKEVFLQESICNLLSEVYWQGKLQEKIAREVFNYLPHLEVNGLMHMIPVLVDAKVYIEADWLPSFLSHPNIHVQELVKDALKGQL